MDIEELEYFQEVLKSMNEIVEELLKKMLMILILMKILKNY